MRISRCSGRGAAGLCAGAAARGGEISRRRRARETKLRLQARIARFAQQCLVLLQRIEKPEKVSSPARISRRTFSPVSSGDQRPPALRGETEQQRVAEEPGELAEQRRRILAVLPERFELRERFLGIPGENGVRNGLRAERSGQSHGVEHRRGVYRFRRGALVEQRKAVAHAAVGKAASEAAPRPP